MFKKLLIDKMVFRHLTKVLFISLIMFFIAGPGFGQALKIGYVYSQKILADYKEAQDAQRKLDEFIRQWENEGLEMQQKFQQLREQFEAQSLLLSEAKKREKEQEMQNLYLHLHFQYKHTTIEYFYLMLYSILIHIWHLFQDHLY